MDVKVPITGVEGKAQIGSVAMIIDGPHRSEINDFKGRSQCVRTADGRISIAVQDQPHWGKRNEAQVLKVLTEVLGAEGYAEADARDDARGVDGFVRSRDGTPHEVQIVSVPAESDYAASVARGDTST